MEPSRSAISGEKKELLDFTIGTKKIRIYVKIESQLGLNYVLISNGMCQYEGTICLTEQKYGTVTEREFRKKIQSMETYQNDAIEAANLSPENALGDGLAFPVPCRGLPRYGFFFKDQRIRVIIDQCR